MADNSFRAFRTRPLHGEADSPELGLDSDPLAELARLIGQSDPVGERSRSARQPVTLGDMPGAAAPVPSPGWQTDDGYEEPDRHEERTERPASRAYPASERGYDRDPEPPARYPAPPVAFDDARHSSAVDHLSYRDEFAADSLDSRLPALAPQSDDDGYDVEEWRDAAEDPSYAGEDEDYDDQAPVDTRRRTGVIVAVAVLGLVVVGAGGAFAYRTMFGGQLLPSLPPIIKAGDGPNKIIPNPSNSQADAASPGNAATGGTGEKLVSREEQPLNIQTPPDSGPRVISTIPVLQGPGGAAQGAPPPAAGGAAPVPGVTTAAPVPAAPSTPGAAPWPNAPAPLAAAPSPPAVSTAPKKIHTVVIREDQPAGTAVASPAPAPPAAPAPRSPPLRSAHQPAPPAPRLPAREASGNAPLDLLHQQPGEALPAPPPPQPTHVARVEAPEAPLPLGPGGGSPVAAGGGYAVQVSSQRSEAEARASFQALRAKYPGELGGRQPIIRRADLGAKGTYYRAFVGPFASAEDAAAMCSRLKAAGGSCIVQRD